MLQNTFLHLPGIGIKSEQNLWNRDIRTWDDYLASPFPGNKAGKVRASIRESQEQLQNKNVHYFADHLPTTNTGDSFPSSGSQPRIWTSRPRLWTRGFTALPSLPFTMGKRSSLTSREKISTPSKKISGNIPYWSHTTADALASHL